MASATEQLTPALHLVLDGLIRFRLWSDGSVGCAQAQRMQCDTRTQQCECKCPAGSKNDFSCASSTATQNSVMTSTIVLTTAALVVVAIGIIALPIIGARAMNTALELNHTLLALMSPQEAGMAVAPTSAVVVSVPVAPLPIGGGSASLRQRAGKPTDASSMLLLADS